jgi:hypothetical protein
MPVYRLTRRRPPGYGARIRLNGRRMRGKNIFVIPRSNVGLQKQTPERANAAGVFVEGHGETAKWPLSEVDARRRASSHASKSDTQ